MKEVRNFIDNLGNSSFFYISAKTLSFGHFDKFLNSKFCKNVFKATHVVRWGKKPSFTGRVSALIAFVLRKKILYIEDGLIRSFDIGLSGEPSLSMIADGVSAYYDATKQTDLQKMLNSSFRLSSSQLEYARTAMSVMRQHQITKYNNNLDFPSSRLGKKSRPRILLIDQRKGDVSISLGLACAKTFLEMLEDAVSLYPGYDILVKQHPDASIPGYHSCLSNKVLKPYLDKITVLSENYNPYALFDQVDKVFVVTSQMGFEALITGKEVHCYGIPFYAGRGLTNDKQTLLSHARCPSTLEDIFYVTYVLFSVYYSPKQKRRCDLLELLDYFVGLKSI